MAKLNRKASLGKDLRGHKDATVNEEGGLAFKLDDRTELYTRVVTCLFGEPKFYDPEHQGDERILQLVESVSKMDPEFVLQLAAYARNDMYLRTIPQVLLVEACRHEGTKKYVRQYVPSIIRRADELTEVTAFYKKRNGKLGTMCNPLRRGIATAFNQFDAYQLAKYDRNGEVKLRDVLRLVHPTPMDEEQKRMWGLLVKRELPVPETWETAISGGGSKKDNWEKVLPHMGYMAVLRNLRNFIKCGVDLGPVLKRLTDPEEIRKSKQLPFRFYSAYSALSSPRNPWKDDETELDTMSVHKAMDAMQTALEVSVDNLPELKGKTFMSADNSGSMDSSLSDRSTVALHQIANLLQSMAHKICDEAITSVFGDTFEVVYASKADGIITNMQKFRDTGVGCSTNAWLSVKWLNDKKEKVDRIIIFSDMQCYSTQSISGWMPGARMGYGDQGQSLAEQFDIYKRKVNPKAKLYSIDLAGYGTAQFPLDDGSVVLLAGWSEKVLDFINRYEQSGEEAISAIKKVKPLPVKVPDKWFREAEVDDATSDVAPAG